MCEKKFNKREHMISHQYTQRDCLLCDQVFKTSKDLTEHIKIVHDEMICHLSFVKEEDVQGVKVGDQ